VPFERIISWICQQKQRANFLLMITAQIVSNLLIEATSSLHLNL
jgi:hypothetical protein